jgi:hypothetical protein
MNITREDCIGMCGLDEAEVRAIAEHEQISDVAAAALGSYLLHEPAGAPTIRTMIVDDIRAAVHRRDFGHARELLAALRHFVGEHRDELGRRAAAPAQRS